MKRLAAVLCALALSSCMNGSLVQWCNDNPDAKCFCGTDPKDDNCCVLETGPCVADADCCAAAPRCVQNADGQKVCTAPQ